MLHTRTLNVKAIIVFHVLVTVTYSNSYVKAIIVSTFWLATTKYTYNFRHTKHYSISDLFRIFLYSTKSNLVNFRWLLYSITIEICWNT